MRHFGWGFNRDGTNNIVIEFSFNQFLGNIFTVFVRISQFVRKNMLSGCFLFRQNRPIILNGLFESIPTVKMRGNIEVFI